MKPARGRRQRPALQQQRNDNDDKSDVEIEIGLGEPDQHRNRGQEDRDRATSIKTSATITAGTMLTTSRCGDTRSPSRTNITICASQVAASRNVTTELCARVGRLPMMIPAR